PGRPAAAALASLPPGSSLRGSLRKEQRVQTDEPRQDHPATTETATETSPPPGGEPGLNTLPPTPAGHTPEPILVSTPIGNLGDLSPRAVATLKAADAILCEDTRVTAPMLARHGVSAPLVPLHDHNEDQATPRILARIARGERLALVSDAGTPLMSDPGFRLV